MSQDERVSTLETVDQYRVTASDISAYSILQERGILVDRRSTEEATYINQDTNVDEQQPSYPRAKDLSLGIFSCPYSF